MYILKIMAVSSMMAAVAAASDAATITFNNDTDITAGASSGVGTSGLRGSVTCTLLCSGLFYTSGAYGFGDPGEVFDGPASSGDANEAAWVNSVLGTSFTGADVGADYQDNDSAFVTSALYVIMKLGNDPDYLIIRNDSGVEQTFSFAKAAKAKGGLSHSFGLGTPPTTPIPLPAAGWLMLAGIAGLGAFRRRKRS